MSDVTVRVNGHPLTHNDVENAIQALSMEIYRKTMDHLLPDEYQEIRDLALEKVITQLLIFQEALSRGVVASTEEIFKEEERQMSSFPSKEEFYAKIQSVGIDPLSYHRMLRHDLTVNMMTEMAVGPDTEPTRQEIEEAYRVHREMIKKPLRVRVSHILVRIEDGDREKALAKIADLQTRMDTQDFGELAKEFSQCPSGHLGGDLGYIKKGDMPRTFENAALTQPVGIVAEPVETQFGFHLLKILEREEEVDMPFDEAIPTITDFLKKRSRARKFQEWVATLKERAVIEVL